MQCTTCGEKATVLERIADMALCEDCMGAFLDERARDEEAERA
jgi:predicted nucleic acid-binding Zn ribbon protein